MVGLPVWLLFTGLWGCLCFFTFVVPATPARMDRATALLIENVPFWEALVGNGIARSLTPGVLAVLLAVFGGGAFLLYGIAIAWAWTAAAAPRHLPILGGMSVVFLITAVAALPTQNTDVFNYMVQGRVSAVHGQNPYLNPPIAFPEDPILPYASQQYATEANDYLPAWSIFNSALARLAGDDPMRGLIVYRVAFAALTVGSLLLIVGILMKVSPGHVPAGVVTFGWNPIVILEGPSRVDTLMAFLALLAVLLIVRRRLMTGTAILMLSVLTKWITLPLLLSLGMGRVWRKQWTTLLMMVAVAALATAVVYAPFLESADILRMHFDMLMRGGSSAPKALRWVLGLGLILLVIWFGRFQDEDREMALWSWAVLLLYFTAFLTKLGFSWYLIVPAAFVALVRETRILLPFLALSLGAFAFQARDGAFNSRYDIVDLVPMDRFWVFLGLSALLTVATALVIRRRSSDA